MSETGNAPSKYSRNEIKQIQDVMGTPGALIACPICEGPLTVSHPVDGPRGLCFFVGCRPCNHNAMITDVPGLWQPTPRG